MTNNECEELNHQLVESFIDSKNEEKNIKIEGCCEVNLNRLNVIFEQFEKQKKNIASFVKEISFLTQWFELLKHHRHQR
jgi:hypothetical protein